MAAERGCGQSMHILGGLHHTGLYESTIDLEKAIQYYENAVHTKSIYMLGLVYMNGEGTIAADERKSAIYLHNAAEKGHLEACTN